METSCLDLALEGERLCKSGDYRAGVSFFESAIEVGTEDLQILSAIYSQLGNAYFHLQEYNKALEYHRHDLTLTRSNTEEKIIFGPCANEHRPICPGARSIIGQYRDWAQKESSHRAICWSGAEPGEFPEEARVALRKAAQYYEANLSMVKELGDRPAQGRTYGNLGNTYYLLGDFKSAVAAHEKRLLIAKEFGDRSAERRAHCNLGNAHIFLNQFDVAASHYKRTLQLARLLKDRAVEAQACYSLGNTYTLLHDYERAIDYHLKHLVIAQDLNDRVGEGRAYWSLGNAHTALGNHEQAMYFAEKHLEIAKETGDKSSEVTARMNLSDLRLVVGLKSNSNNRLNIYHNTNTNSSALPPLCPNYTNDEDVFSKPSKANTIKASTKLFLFQRLKSKKQKNNKTPAKGHPEITAENPPSEMDSPVITKVARDTIGEDGFFDLLYRFQGSRMDDQRCTLLDDHSPPPAQSSPLSTPPVRCTIAPPSQDPGHFLELLASSQARRLDDQRASLSHFPGLRLSTSNPLHSLHTSTEPAPSDEVFFDMLVKCQGSRLNDQRCAAPSSTNKGPTVPDEDFFSLIMRSQSNRMEEQRVTAPPAVTQPKPD
uniref:G protein signaling modulator 2, like n=1 Tax=Periophthalmus magnuspinnatus TaxID=409849 RepID=A0A3B3ZNQ0_9GOBI